MNHMLRIVLSTLLVLLCFQNECSASRRDGKPQRKIERLQDYQVKTLEELIDQGLWHTEKSEFLEAKRRFQLAMTLDRENKFRETLLVYLAGLEFQMGNPKIALRSVRSFGEKHADSPLITNMVQLAFELGKAYTLGKTQDYTGWFRVSRAMKAFEFVNTHDPYSIEAAKALLSMAVLQMKRRNWAEAISYLQDVHRKQPATDIAAKADVILGECYLGANKGADYDRRNLVLAERYLKGYLDLYPDGSESGYARSLLNKTYLRIGRGDLDIARYYLTARKWSASKSVLENIVANKNLAIHHREAKELLEYVAPKL
jgi:outer membrane protein assembly factor BamD (BamD/ComL family)